MKISSAFRDALRVYRAHFGDTVKFLIVEACLVLAVLTPLLFLSNSGLRNLALLALPLYLLVIPCLREVMDSLRPLLAEDGLVLLEHEAGVEITAASGYELVKERKWGFCAFSFYARSAENASPAGPGGTMKGQEKE